MKSVLIILVFASTSIATLGAVDLQDQFEDAVVSHQEDRIEKLLEMGADPNGNTRIGHPNPLFLDAARRNLSTAVALFLKQGVDPAMVDDENQTALHIAADAQADRVIPILLKAGGYGLNSYDKRGWTPLLYAATGNAQIIRLLVKAGANVDQVSNDKYRLSPLVRAADRGRVDAVTTLLELGATVKGEAGKRAVQCATSYNTENHANTILILAKAGADLDSSLNDAIGRHKCLAALLQGGANVNARWANDMTPLIYAIVIAADSVAVKIILKSKPDLDAKAKFPFVVSGFSGIPPQERYFDKTALMCAAESGRLDLVKSLVEAGARIEIKNRSGETAVDLAVKSHHTEVVEFLKKSIEPSAPANGASPRR